MRSPSIIVIGASAGGVDALQSLVANLPEDFPAPILVVLHIGAHKSELPALLGSAGPLAAKHAEHHETVRAGTIYVAPPDHHMMLEGRRVRLTRGPRENWARPAINPLFRSAAEACGSAAIGVILTGRLNDGTTGLCEIKRHGGVTIVQDPDDAAYDDMPRSAKGHVIPDFTAPLAEMATLLVRLVAEPESQARPGALVPHILQEGGAMTDEHEFERPVAVTCPDCGGAMRQHEVGALIEYRCHVQHVFTAEVLAEAQFDQMERVMRAAERIVHERAEFCCQMAARAGALSDSEEQAVWRRASRQALDRAYELRDLIEQDWMRPEADLRSLDVVD